MINIQNLEFAYPDNGFRLHVDDLSIGGGERVAWTGASGSGKTTLLHLVAGIMLPTAGSVECCGRELPTLNESARRDFRITNVGLVFQEFELLEYLTVIDNILLAYRINRTVQLSSDVRTRAHQLATDLGIEDLVSRYPAKLSHGERQRVSVCRALIANPKLVLADEPTANLDPANTSRVLDALDRHVEQNDATLVVVTHDKDVVSRFDRTIDVEEYGVRPVAVRCGGHSDD